MSQIKSKLGTTHFESSTPQMFEIPDETATPGTPTQPPAFDISQMQPGVPVQLSPEQYKEMRAALQQQKVQQEKEKHKIPATAQDRIRFLLGIGSKTTDVPIGDNIWTLRSLKNKEYQAVTSNAMSKATTVADTMFLTRTYTLAYSLIKIDGFEVEMQLGSDKLEVKVAFIEECELSTINKLYQAYEEMVKEIAIKTTEEAVEVVEQIKK